MTSEHSRPLRLAHRGAGGYVKENTVEAFQWAVDHRERVDGVELDVFVSQDGEAVIHHDPVTKEGGLELASHSARELWEKTSVPTLRQVLRLCLQGGLKVVVVELKGENTPHPVAAVFSELLEEFGTERVFSSLRISGFLHDVIDAFGAIEAFSAIPRAYTASVCSDELIDRAVQHGITDLHLHQHNVDADLVNKIHQHKLKLMTYSSGTIQESEEILNHVKSLQPDFYCLNDPISELL